MSAEAGELLVALGGLDEKDAGLAAAARLAKRADPDPHHSYHVCAVALALFDATAPLHRLDKEARRLLAAAALLHDTGWSTKPDEHNKGSRDFILQAELPGFAPAEIRVMACVARYHSKAHPQQDHRVYRDLGKAEQALVGRLASLLRIADGLDRSHASATEVIGVARQCANVRIRALQRKVFTEDAAGAMRKAGLFEETFGVHVEVRAEPVTSA